MIPKFPMRKARKPDEIKENLGQDEDIKHNLKSLTECVIQMTKEMKEMRKENEKLVEKVSELKVDSGKAEKQELAHQKNTSLDARMEKRFQDVDLAIPTLGQKDDAKKREQITFDWIAKLCKAVFSIGFNLYESGVLDINKVKAYCSENLIRSFIKFSKKNNPTPEEIGKINDFLVDDLLPYFCLKYPESEEAETSTKFSSGLIQRDDMDNNDYDLVYKSGVDFSYKENGNYNSQIMKLLNYIISLTEKSVPVKYTSEPEDKEKEKDKEKDKDKNKKPLNKLFIEDMGSIFRMVQIEENTLQMQMFDPKNPDQTKKQRKKTLKISEKENEKQIQDQVEKQKKRKEKEYREKVLLYTNFQIGQKLSKNLKPFSNSDIESGNLTLSSSDVIRALTKWAEELEKCYKKEYFYERDAPFRMRDGSQRYLGSIQAHDMIYSFSQQSKEIEKIKQEIKQNNNKNQSMLMGYETYQRLVRLSEEEASVGQFASSTFKNNITYLISYLNALIHGINIAIRYRFLGESDNKLPQLITFSIGDLLRCKCSSKENEIIALYKEIERRHRQPDSGIKIIRVKNRLNRGNKDILMNLLYRGEMVVQMQLVIKSDKSKFIQCSYNFNHYLYQLKRAQFGPIMEMCNVWMNKDSKGKFFLEKMEKLNVRNKKKVEQSKGDFQKKLQDCCMKNKKQMKLPFRCSLCDCFFSASSLLENNIECKQCKIFTCYLCQLQISDVEMKKFIKQIPEIQNQEVVPYQKIQKESGGVLVKLKSTTKKQHVVFTISEHKQKFYMFECDEVKKKVNLIQKFDYPQIPASFLKQHLVLAASALKEKISQFNQEYKLPILKYFTEEYLKEAYKTEKTSITLKNQELSKQMLEIQKITNWPHTKKINFSENKNMNLQKIMEKFPNVENAVLSYSNFQQDAQENKGIQNLNPHNGTKIAIMKQLNHPKSSYRQFGYFQHLKQLQIQRSNMQEFPQYLCQAKLLQKLNVNNNKLRKLPSSITQLQKLQILNMRWNKLGSLPQDIGKMKSIRKLDIWGNQLQEIPDSFCNLSQLTQLILVGNQIKKLPSKNERKPKKEDASFDKTESNTANIDNLRQKSQLKLHQADFGNLTSLLKLQLNNNQLNSLPQHFGNLVNLQELNLNENKLESLPQHFGNLINLQILTLGENQLKSLPQHFGNLVNLQKLYLHENKLESLPQHFGNLANLQILTLGYNQLKSLPQHFGNLTNLQMLGVQDNQLESLPQNFGNLTNINLLDLQNNQLITFPQQLQHLQKLSLFNLSNNKLQSLPEFIGDFSCLKQLILHKNQLKQLPSSMSVLKSLQKLDISQNKLTKLPEALKDLTTLKSVQVISNKLTEIPSWLFTLSNLNQLCFSVIDDLTFPPNLAELRSNSVDKLTVYIEYYQEYEKQVLEIQKQSTGRIEIQIRKIKSS